MLQNSNFGRTFLFLTELAWKNRVALPALIMVGCMVFNFRWEIEINIHTERIAVQDLPGRAYGGAAFGGIAIDHLEDYTDDEDDDEDDEDDDDDDEQYDEFYDSDYDEDEDDDSSFEDDYLYYSSNDEDEEGVEGLAGTLNGMIRINRYAVVNFHNARR